MNPAATPVPGGPSPASPAGGSESAPSTTVRIRPDVAALPAYVPGARPDAATAAQIAKLSSNELPYPPQDAVVEAITRACLLYTSPSPRDVEESRMPSSA